MGVDIGVEGGRGMAVSVAAFVADRVMVGEAIIRVSVAVCIGVAEGCAETCVGVAVPEVPVAGANGVAVTVSKGIADTRRVGKTTLVRVGEEGFVANGVVVGAEGEPEDDGVDVSITGDGVGVGTRGDGVGVAGLGVCGAVGTVWRCGPWPGVAHAVPTNEPRTIALPSNSTRIVLKCLDRSRSDCKDVRPGLLIGHRRGSRIVY